MPRNLTISSLYSRYLSSAEKRSLRQVPLDDTSSEINLLRVLNSLLLKIQRSAPKDFYSRVQALRTCVILNEQLALLVRAHERVHGPHSELEDAISSAVESLAEEWKNA